MKKPYKAMFWIGVDSSGMASLYTHEPIPVRTVIESYWAPAEGSTRIYFGPLRSRRGECFRVMVTEIPKRTTRRKP